MESDDDKRGVRRPRQAGASVRLLPGKVHDQEHLRLPQRFAEVIKPTAGIAHADRLEPEIHQRHQNRRRERHAESGRTLIQTLRFRHISFPVPIDSWRCDWDRRGTTSPADVAGHRGRPTRFSLILFIPEVSGGAQHRDNCCSLSNGRFYFPQGGEFRRQQHSRVVSQRIHADRSAAVRLRPRAPGR